MLFNNGDNSTKSIDLMQRTMGLCVLRNQVINNNISNATTPNYKRKDVTFNAELERALNSEKEFPGVPFKTSRDRHIPSFRIKNYRNVRSEITTDFNTYQNNNGNSVDIDFEMMESTKNTMLYNALAQRTAKEFNKLKFLLRQ